MTLLTYIFIVVLGAGALDFLLDGNERAQNVLYKVTFFAVWFLFVIRYYYGPDIATYVPVYENMRPWYWYLHHPDDCRFEHGYMVFSAMIKDLGFSYYWLTVVITTLYFGIIALLFKRIKLHKTLALTILVMFDFNLIYAENRQCLSVCFFLIMVLLMDKKQYVWALLCALISTEMHKSGIFMVSLTWLFFILHRHKLERGFFLLILVFLCAMLVLPVSSICSTILSSLPLPKSLEESLNLHLAMGRQIQAMWLIYAAIIVFIEYYLQHRNEIRRGTEATVIMGLVVITIFYHYFYFLGRLRSFFLPVLLVYLCNVVQGAEEEAYRNSYMSIVKSVGIVMLLVFFSYRATLFELDSHKLRHTLHTPGGKGVCSPCTIFDLPLSQIKIVHGK